MSVCQHQTPRIRQRVQRRQIPQRYPHQTHQKPLLHRQRSNDSCSRSCRKIIKTIVRHCVRPRDDEFNATNKKTPSISRESFICIFYNYY